MEAEYRSAAITQQLGLWLIQLGAPPTLIADSQRIVADEMIHSEKSYAVFVAAGGSGAPAIARETLGLARSPASLEQDVARAAVEVFCLGETVAVRLFKRLRQECTVPVARRALDRILRDEVRHREFGWTLLEWLLSTPFEADLRALLARELTAMLRRVRANYGVDAAAPHRAPRFEDTARAWGLMPIADYAAAARETFERDYTPRFADLGFVVPA